MNTDAFLWKVVIDDFFRHEFWWIFMLGMLPWVCQMMWVLYLQRIGKWPPQ